MMRTTWKMHPRIITLFLCAGLAAALFLMVGCAGVPEPEVPEVPAEEPETLPEPEPEPEPVRIEESHFMVNEERFYYPDGTLDEYRVYTYMEDNGPLLTQEALYDAFDDLQEQVTVTYTSDDTLSRERTIFDGSGNIRQKRVYTYDGSGNLKEENTLNNQDELQARMVYTYDNHGRRVKWEIYDQNNALLGFTEYTYENGLNTKTENFSPGGRVEEYFELIYNDEGHLTRNTQFDSNGRTQGYRVFVYEAGLLTDEVIHRANGSVLRRMLHTHDDQENPVETVVLDGGNNVRERVSRSFEEYITVRYE